MFSVLASAPLMKKVSMPKYIFPLSKAISALVNFFFSTVALFVVMLVTGSPIYPTILLAPLPILYIFIFSLGIGFILATAIVYFRDMSYVYGVFITAIPYITPRFYPIKIIPNHFRWLISINPLYHFVECYRTVVIYGGVPSLWQNLICSLLALISLVVGVTIFYKQQDKFILYV
jgi:ABC-type polysaccharide/polyol phosphate export permease